MASTRFKGPGQWRSQAEAARGLDDNVFAQMAEMARRLHDLGQDDAAELVHQAEKLALDGKADEASAKLLEASGMIGSAAPPYAQGMREVARALPEHAEPLKLQISDDDGIPGMHPS